MALSSLSFYFLCFLLFTPSIFSYSSPTSPNPNQISATSFCKNAPYPDACFHSLKLSLSINISPNILSFLLQTLKLALSEAGKLTDLLSAAGISNNLVEGQRGSLQDCKDLHHITSSVLKRSLSKISEDANDPRKLAAARAYLSAALTNKNTCLEGLDSASGPLKPKLVTSFTTTYKHVSNSLSALSKQRKTNHLKTNSKTKNRRLLGLFPDWISGKDRRFLEDSGDEYDEYEPSEILIVAADGTGNFTTINEAISFAPNMSNDRVLIYVREGEYNENIEIPSYKTNIVLIGDGSDVTFVTGNRSVGDGWTTFRSATLGNNILWLFFIRSRLDKTKRKCYIDWAIVYHDLTPWILIFLSTKTIEFIFSNLMFTSINCFQKEKKNGCEHFQSVQEVVEFIFMLF